MKNGTNMIKNKTEIKKENVVEEKPPVLETTEKPEKDVKQESLKDLVEKNIKWTQVVYEQNQQIKHRLTMIALGSWLRLLLILVPLILAFIFLPPLLEKMLGQYGGLLQGLTGEGAQGGAMNLNQLPMDQIQEILNTIRK